MSGVLYPLKFVEQLLQSNYYFLGEVIYEKRQFLVQKIVKTLVPVP